VPGWLDKPGTGLEVLSNYCKKPLTLDTVFPYQKADPTYYTDPKVFPDRDPGSFRQMDSACSADSALKEMSLRSRRSPRFLPAVI